MYLKTSQNGYHLSRPHCTIKCCRNPFSQWQRSVASIGQNSCNSVKSLYNTWPCPCFLHPRTDPMKGESFLGGNHATSIVEIVGMLMFALYHVIVLIVLINMLIAMMSHSFEDIQVRTLQRRHNERNGISNHWRPDGLLNRLFRRRSKKTPKLRVTSLCQGNSRWPMISPHKGPVTPKMFPFDDVIKQALNGRLCQHPRVPLH